MAYTDRLKDPRWQRRRLEIMKRAQFRCERCTAAYKALHVHHRRYRKDAMPWEYSDDELKCLCEDCHETETKLRQRLNDVIRSLEVDQLTSVLDYAEGRAHRALLDKMPRAMLDVMSIEQAEILWRIRRIK